MKRQKTKQLSEHLLATQEERAVIGVMILATKSYAKIASVLTVEDFFDEQCRELFLAAGRLHKKGSPIDTILLLREMDNVPPKGDSWIYTIAKFARLVPHTVHLDWYMKTVKEASRRRQLTRQCERCLARLREGQDAEEAAKELPNLEWLEANGTQTRQATSAEEEAQ